MALPALSGNDMPARRAAPAYRRSACPYAADASMTRPQSPLSAPADLSSVKHSGVRHGPAPRLPADIKVKPRRAHTLRAIHYASYRKRAAMGPNYFDRRNAERTKMRLVWAFGETGIRNGPPQPPCIGG